MRLAAALASTLSIQEINEQNNKLKALEDNVKNFEIKLSACFAEHNLPIVAIEPIVDVLKNSVSDSEIIQKSTLKRTKCTEIIKNV